jgi:hypothetical protein
MTSKHTKKRHPSKTSAAKLFITTSSVAAVLGGWVAFTSQTPSTTNPTETFEASFNLDPIPTVVPHPLSRPEDIQPVSQPVDPQTSSPTLRSVQVPAPAPAPAAVTVTRSSR